MLASGMRILRLPPPLFLLFGLAFGATVLSGPLSSRTSAQDPKPAGPALGERGAVPVGISEVRIGYFGPDDPDDALSGDLWLAASMAVEELNRENGYRGLPYRLIAGWSNDPWGSGVKRVTRMVYEDRVWALIAPVDGPSNHLAEQVVAKARLSLLNPGSSDRTANLANVPWIFSGLPGEDLQVPVLFDTLVEKKGERAFILISATDHDSRVLTTEFERYISTRGVSPSLHLKYDPGESRSLQALEDISEDEVGTVVIFAGPRESATIVKIIRTRFRSPILGGPAMGRSLFLKLTDASLKRIFFPLLGEAKPGDPFVGKFRERYNRTPDFAAIQTYDLMCLLGQAIEEAGLERERIRDEIRILAPWNGVNGIVDWDQFGQNKRMVRLATIENGEVRVVARGTIQKD